jgi:small-conductance mechanosensitive channel
VVHQLILQIIRRFREEQIEIPFPQRDLHVKELPQANKGNQLPDDGG